MTFPAYLFFQFFLNATHPKWIIPSLISNIFCGNAGPFCRGFHYQTPFFVWVISLSHYNVTTHPTACLEISLIHLGNQTARMYFLCFVRVQHLKLEWHCISKRDHYPGFFTNIQETQHIQLLQLVVFWDEKWINPCFPFSTSNLTELNFIIFHQPGCNPEGGYFPFWSFLLGWSPCNLASCIQSNGISTGAQPTVASKRSFGKTRQSFLLKFSGVKSWGFYGRFHPWMIHLVACGLSISSMVPLNAYTICLLELPTNPWDLQGIFAPQTSWGRDPHRKQRSKKQQLL